MENTIDPRNLFAWELSLARLPAAIDTKFRLTHSAGVTIDLASDVEAFVRAQLRAGVCSDAGDLVNDILRSLRDQQRKPFELTPELEEWLLKAADKPTTPLTAQDFDGIRQRVLGRTPNA